jgi:MFS family permease
LLRLPESPESSEHLEKADEKLSLKMDLESQKEDRYSRTLRYGYIILLLAMSVKGMGDRSLSTYMTTYLVSNRGLTRSMASLIYGFNPVLGILGSLSGGYLADRVGSKRWMILAYLGRAFVLAGMYLSPVYALIIIYFIGGYFGGSTMGPSSSLVASLSPRRRRGLAYAIFMLPFSLVGAISPMIAAQIIEAYNVAALFPFAIFLTLVSILLLKQFPRTRVGNNT